LFTSFEYKEHTVTFKTSRRDLLAHAGLGLGGLALSGLLPGGVRVARASELADPLAPRQTHFPAKAKSVIWLHQNGAPSTLDLFDYKPELVKLAGQEVPASFLKGIKTSTQGGVGKLFVSNRRTWKQYGASGAWFSDLVPNLARHADELTFIKSSVTIGATHDISILKLNTGDLNPGRPTLGAWVTYALGAANPDLRGAVWWRQGAQRRLGQLERGLPAGRVSRHRVPSGTGADRGSGTPPAQYRRAAT
jgi:hypothetical protein